MKFPIREPWKLDTRFDEPVAYGPHEGIDVNLPSGGNTDCGTDLFPIFKGEIVHTSKSTKGYGNLLVLRIVGPWGERFVRYAHCDKFLKTKGIVTAEEPIAQMGSTGNSTACHLHFDVMKSIPKGNWRYYTKTKSVFMRVFEDPLAFIEQWRDYKDENIKWLIDYMREKGIDPLNEGSARGQLQTIFDGNEKYKEKQKRIERLEEELAGAQGEAAENEARLRTLEKNREENKREVEELNKQLHKDRDELKRLNNVIVKQQVEIDNLKKKPSDTPPPSDKKFPRLIRWLLRRNEKNNNSSPN